MSQNAITSAVGALKLVPMFLNHPTVISRATLTGAAAEALTLLEGLPPAAVELIEAFRCVEQVIAEGQVAYVTPTNSPEFPLGAVVADANGQVCAAASGKTKEGLAELIRLKLLPPTEGRGETP